MRQGDTPYPISPNAGLLRDQDEKRSLTGPSKAVPDSTKLPALIRKYRAATIIAGHVAGL